MTIASLITQLQTISSQEEYTPLELKRFTKDLSKTLDRLKTHDYQRFSYSNNVFDVPTRTQEIYTELEFYCQLGQTWQQVLEQLDLAKYPVIADLCCGFTPKIELGLYYSKYHGQVTLIDKDPEALDQLEQFLRLFRPAFTLTRNTSNLFEAIPQSYQVVLGNHVIDDLAIDYFAQKAGLTAADIYSQERALHDLWQEILSNRDQNLNLMTTLIADILEKLVATGGILVLSQYPSYFERMLGLAEVSTFNQELFHEVVKKLKTRDFTQDTDTITRALSNFKGHFMTADCVLLRKNT